MPGRAARLPEPSVLVALEEPPPWGLTLEVDDAGRFFVQAVERGGAAERAGLRVGQVLHSVNGRSALNPAKAKKLLAKKPPLSLALCPPPGGEAGGEGAAAAAAAALSAALGAEPYDEDAAANALADLADLMGNGLGGVSEDPAVMAQAAAVVAAGGVIALGNLLHQPELPAAMESAALLVLATVAALPESRPQFVGTELVDKLVEVLEEREAYSGLSLAACALANLTADVPSDTAAAVVFAGAIEALISILRRLPDALSDDGARSGQWAAAALCNLCRQGPEAAQAVARCDGVAVIHAALENGDDAGAMHQFLCGCLCNLAVVDGEGLLASGGVGAAESVLQSGGKSRTRAAAAQVISNLLTDASPSVYATLDLQRGVPIPSSRQLLVVSGWPG